MTAQKFYIAKDNTSPAIRVYEVCGNTLYYLNRETRTGLRFVRSHDPTSIIRQDAILTFGKASQPDIEEVPFKVGTYHPSIARPIFQNPDMSRNIDFSNQINFVRQFERQIGILIHEIEECFDVVSPNGDNFEAYGFVFENIIHLSCIEIESLFVKVLQDNNVGTGRYSIRDFKKLNKFMLLSEYSVQLPKYPWLSEIVPFGAWSSQPQTSSLPWHDANNKLKHAKGNNLKAATLRNALEGVCALMIVFFVVFGDDVFCVNLESDLAYFELKQRPRWPIQELYFMAHDKKWSPSHISL